MLSPKSVILSFSFVALVFVVPSRAWLKICNNSWETANVAIGYSSNGIWYSRGWWVIKPGDCAIVLGGDLPNRYYYYYAWSEIENWSGATSFCVNSVNAFTRSDGECTFPYISRNFRQIDTETFENYTFNLTSGYSLSQYAEYVRKKYHPEIDPTKLPVMDCADCGTVYNYREADREVLRDIASMKSD